jgi:hypothetical protein
MKITIKTMSGKQIALEVEETTTVSEKKILIINPDLTSKTTDTGRLANYDSRSPDLNCLWQETRAKRKNTRRI